MRLDQLDISGQVVRSSAMYGGLVQVFSGTNIATISPDRIQIMFGNNNYFRVGQDSEGGLNVEMRGVPTSRNLLDQELYKIYRDSTNGTLRIRG